MSQQNSQPVNISELAQIIEEMTSSHLAEQIQEFQDEITGRSYAKWNEEFLQVCQLDAQFLRDSVADFGRLDFTFTIIVNAEHSVVIDSHDFHKFMSGKRREMEKPNQLTPGPSTLLILAQHWGDLITSTVTQQLPKDGDNFSDIITKMSNFLSLHCSQKDMVGGSVLAFMKSFKHNPHYPLFLPYGFGIQSSADDMKLELTLNLSKKTIRLTESNEWNCGNILDDDVTSTLKLKTTGSLEILLEGDNATVSGNVKVSPVDESPVDESPVAPTKCSCCWFALPAWICMNNFFCYGCSKPGHDDFGDFVVPTGKEDPCSCEKDKSCNPFA